MISRGLLLGRVITNQLETFSCIPYFLAVSMVVDIRPTEWMYQGFALSRIMYNLNEATLLFLDHTVITMESTNAIS